MKQYIIIDNIKRFEKTTKESSTLCNKASDQIIHCGEGFKCRANYFISLEITFPEYLDDIENVIASYFILKGEEATEIGLIKYIKAVVGKEIESIQFLEIEKFYAYTLPSGSVVTSEPIVILSETNNINV